jgi:hypothetical protein
MRWQDWTTRRKLITGFGMVLFFSIIIALVGYLNMKNIYQKQKNYILLNNVAEQLSIGRYNSRLFIELKDTAYLTSAILAQAKCRENFIKLKGSLDLTENKALETDFINLLGSFDSLVAQSGICNQQINELAAKRRTTRDIYTKEFKEANLSRNNDINYYFDQGKSNTAYLLTTYKESFYNDAQTAFKTASASTLQ